MENLYELMREFLRKRGIVASDTERGRLSFSVNSLNYIFEFFENDPFFFRLWLPKITNKCQAYDNMSNDIQRLNRNFKVAKIIVQENNELWIVADQFVYSTIQIDYLFERIIQAMGDMINEYHQLENQQINGTEGHQ